MCSIQIHPQKTFPSTSISQTSLLQVTFQFEGINLNYDYITASHRKQIITEKRQNVFLPFMNRHFFWISDLQIVLSMDDGIFTRANSHRARARS